MEQTAIDKLRFDMAVQQAALAKLAEVVKIQQRALEEFGGRLEKLRGLSVQFGEAINNLDVRATGLREVSESHAAALLRLLGPLTAGPSPN